MGSALELISMGRELAKALASAEDKMRVMELAARAADLEEENRELRREVAELREELARRKGLETYRGASYVLEGDGTRTGPVCKACYDEHDLVVILESSADGGARCPSCRRRYPGVKASKAGPRQRFL